MNPRGLRRRSALLRLVVALGAALLAAPAAASAQEGTTTTTAPGPTARAGVSLVRQSTWVPLGGEFVMVLHLDDPVLAARPGAAIAIRVHDRATSRSEFDAAINGDLGGIVYQPSPISVASLKPDKHHNVGITFGLAGSGVQPTIGITRPGSFPVEVALTNTGVPSTAFVTWLVTVDTSSDRPVDKKLSFSFVWQLTAAPATQPDGSINAEVAKEMRPGGRLDRVATLLDRTGDFPYTLVAGPETLEAWQRLAHENGAYADGFSRVRRAARRDHVELLPAPYVPIDIPSLDAGGLGRHLQSEYDAGARAVRASVGAAPSAHAEAAFVDPVNDAAVDTLRLMLADRVVVRDPALQPATHPFTPAQTFVLTTTGGRSRAAATAPFIESLFVGPDPPALKAQRVIAALAEVAYEAPGIARGLVVAATDDWRPDVATITTVVDWLRENPLVTPTTLDRFFTDVTLEQRDGVDVERSLAPMIPADAPVTVSEYESAVSQLEAYRDVVGARDATVTAGERALLIALSAKLSPAEADAYLATVQHAVGGFAAGVTADAKRVTLTSKRARIPLGFVNSLKPGREVVVKVHLDSPKLTFPDGADKIVKLKPGNNTVPFTVEARASGTFPMTISVTSPDGRLAFGAPVRVTVRSAVFGGYAVALTALAVAFLALWWANHFRRSRRDRRRPATAAPVT